MLGLLYLNSLSKVVRTSLPCGVLGDDESGGDLSLGNAMPGIKRDIKAVQQHIRRQANQTRHVESASDETCSSPLGQQIYIQNPLIRDICSGTLPECFDSGEDARAQACLLQELREAILDAKMSQPPQNATAHVGEMGGINLPLAKHQVRSDLVAFCNHHLWICVRTLPSSDAPATLLLLFRTGIVSGDYAAPSVETLISTLVRFGSPARRRNVRDRRATIATTIDTDTDEEGRPSSNFIISRPRASTVDNAPPWRDSVAYTPRFV